MNVVVRGNVRKRNIVLDIFQVEILKFYIICLVFILVCYGCKSVVTKLSTVAFTHVGQECLSLVFCYVRSTYS